MQNIKFKYSIFNTDLELNIEKVRNYKDIYLTIDKLAYTLQSSFNIYNESSELSILNKNKKIIPSKYLKDIILKSQKYEELTDYYFNTSQNFKLNKIIFDGEFINISDPIDLGGIAKGYFIALVKNYLDNINVQYEINFGGSILLTSEKKVLVRDMFKPSCNMLEFLLQPGDCIHTSSYYWQVDGVDTHIYVKDKGYEILYKSVSVIDQNPLISDVFSTALYCMEEDMALNYINKYKLKVIYMTKKTIYISKELKGVKFYNKDFDIKLY